MSQGNESLLDRCASVGSPSSCCDDALCDEENTFDSAAAREVPRPALAPASDGIAVGV